MAQKHKKRKQLKGTKEGYNQVKIRVYPDELEEINNRRSLYTEAIELGQNPNDVTHGWVKSKEASLFIKNPNFEGALCD